MPKNIEIWKDRPEKHDFPAAYEYLCLVLDDKAAHTLVTALRRAPTVRRKAKDLLRASALSPLSKDDPHVAENLKKIKKKQALSPVLLVRGDAGRGLPLLIADGYHRICASWHRGENIPVACRIVSRPTRA